VPPAGMRVIVAGRPNPRIPDDVAPKHPLHDERIVRPLDPSPHAQGVQRLGDQELGRAPARHPARAPTWRYRVKDYEPTPPVRPVPGRSTHPRSTPHRVIGQGPGGRGSVREGADGGTAGRYPRRYSFTRSAAYVPSSKRPSVSSNSSLLPAGPLQVMRVPTGRLEGRWTGWPSEARAPIRV
jgi:hypothetical protein